MHAAGAAGHRAGRHRMCAKAAGPLPYRGAGSVPRGPTASPVGTCTGLTALFVLFWCWPPGARGLMGGVRAGGRCSADSGVASATAGARRRRAWLPLSATPPLAPPLAALARMACPTGLGGMSGQAIRCVRPRTTDHGPKQSLCAPHICVTPGLDDSKMISFSELMNRGPRVAPARRRCAGANSRSHHLTRGQTRRV